MFFDDLFAWIQQSPHHHGKGDPEREKWQKATRAEVEKCFSSTQGDGVSFGPFGTIRFPYHAMGTITSLDLFGIDELMLFAFYHINKKRYAKAVDFGANVGLHSLILGRCGYQVRTFEPDPVHVGLLSKNLALNGVTTDLHVAAISLKDGEAEFVRVLGNTMSSHIAGAKSNPYGDLDRFPVKLEAAAPHLEWADLAKIDIEGHEGELITGVPLSVWQNTDAVMEVGTPENAGKIFHHLKNSGVRMFAQKTGWSEVSKIDDVPVSHHEGSLFITSKSVMPWV